MHLSVREADRQAIGEACARKVFSRGDRLFEISGIRCGCTCWQAAGYRVRGAQRLFYLRAGAEKIRGLLIANEKPLVWRKNDRGWRIEFQPLKSRSRERRWCPYTDHFCITKSWRE